MKLAALLLGVFGSTAASAQDPAGPPDRASVTQTIDPCEVAGAADLQLLLSAGLGPYFPHTKQLSRGRHVRISEPQITQARCPSLMLTMRARIRYWKTRGWNQFSTSGEIRFVSPLEARIRHLIVSAGATLKVADLVRAQACLTDIDVVGVNLERIPNWLDDGWVKEHLVDPALGQKCFDVTELVRQFILAGGVIKAQ